MATCETCGNDYDKAFNVVMRGESHTFDSFECAIHALAPTCKHCGTRIVGHAGSVRSPGAHRRRSRRYHVHVPPLRVLEFRRGATPRASHFVVRGHKEPRRAETTVYSPPESLAYYGRLAA